jgi:hypothetical protein
MVSEPKVAVTTAEFGALFAGCRAMCPEAGACHMAVHRNMQNTDFIFGPIVGCPTV